MKKIIVSLIFLIALCHTVYSAPIYSEKEEVPVANGITLTKVTEYHSDHNMTYSYVRADLNNENISVNLLKSAKGTDVLETMSTLAATEPGTVAAVNADFFSLFKGSQGFALGIEVKDGIISQSPINQDTMATISVENNTVTMGYPYFLVTAVAPNGETLEIRHINKHTTYYGNLLMYTNEFNNGLSPAPGGNVVEVVVEDGIVKEFRRKMPAATIPENGCVLVVSEGYSMFFAKNFNVGDPIKFEYALAPSIVNAETAFGGGAMLVSKGSVVSAFSHVISGTHPRSAIGVDESGKILYLVAVDGRQTGSKGMTMAELAALMKSLGCYNAINLDGGGSTRMVASTFWDPEMKPVNSPTENRKVINAVGLSLPASSGVASGITVKADRDAVFIGDTVTFTAAVHDENMRPLSGDVTWTSDFGTMEGNKFTALKGGNATVTATHGEVSGQGRIFVVDQINGIETESRINLSAGQEKTFNIKVFDGSGHYVDARNADAFDIRSSNPSVVSVSERTLKAHKDGSAIITIEKDHATAYISVAVGAEVKEYTDDFETLNGSFKAYPTTVPGSFELTTERTNGGTHSGKLTFDFTQKDNVTKGAYYALLNRIQLHDSSNTISVDMYTDSPLGHELRAQFIDPNGDLVITSFGKNFSKGKWNHLTATIPQDAKRPLKLDRIYVLYVSGEETDKGCVYLDNLQLNSITPTPYVATPTNEYGNEQFEGKGQFAAGALMTDNKTLFVRLANNGIKDYLATMPNSALVGQISSFSSKEDPYALYINLNTTKGGIKATDSSQWSKMANAISKSTRPNVIILANDALYPTEDFKNDVIHKYLASLNKSVFVITASKQNTYKNVDGVGYFTLSRSSDELLDITRIDSCVCLEFNYGATTTFKWKKVF